MDTQEKKKAVIYCRVSTKEQAEEGNSLVTQEKNCREYALKNDYQIVAVFIEQGESAKTADRTELKKLMNFCAVKKNGINAVIAYKIDRVSRNTDDYSQIRILLKRYGVEIKSTSEYFEDTPAGRFMENIIANVAQFDNDVRAERSIGGMKEAMREGRYVWRAPYGYSNVVVEGKATIAPNHLAPLILQAFKEVAQGNQHIEDIRKKLSADTLLNKEGKPICRSYFYTLLQREVYAGWICKFGERHKGKFKQVVPADLFKQVQYVLSQKKKVSKRYRKEHPDFPLRRFISHPSGILLSGGWSKGRNKKYPYYLFRNLNINIRKEKLEHLFKQFVNKHRLDIRHFEKIEKLMKSHIQEWIFGDDRRKEKLEKQKAEFKARMEIIIEKNIKGVIGDEICKQKISEIEAKLFDIDSKLDNIPKTSINYPAIMSTIRMLMLDPASLWDSMYFMDKIFLQWFFFPHGLLLEDNKIRTTKTCKIFQLKEMIYSYESSMVRLREKILNTEDSQISLGFQSSRQDLEAFLEELNEEVAEVTSILKGKKASKFYY